MANATITTDSSLPDDFDPIEYSVEGSFQVCGSTCANFVTKWGVFLLRPGLHIKDTALNKHVENTTVTHVAGQFVHIKPELPDGQYGPQGCNYSMPSYFPQDAVSSYVTGNSLTSASPVPSTPVPSNWALNTLNGPYGDVTWYNIRAEDADKVTISCDVNDGAPTDITLTAVANYRFETPSPILSVVYGAVSNLTNYYNPNCSNVTGTYLAFGNACLTASPPPGIIWTYSISANDTAEQAGSISLWQIVNNFYMNETFSGSNVTSSASSCGDGHVPYGNVLGARDGVQAWNVTGGWHSADAPATGDITSAMSAELDTSFDDYLMYRPGSGADYKDSIWISLGHLRWGFSANTQNAGSGLTTPSTTYTTPDPSTIDTVNATPTFGKLCNA